MTERQEKISKLYGNLLDKWECTIDFLELLDTDEVYVDMDHRRHKSDDGYGGVSIYVKLKTEYKYIQINANENGFVFDGTACFGGISRRPELPMFDSLTALNLLWCNSLIIQHMSTINSELCTNWEKLKAQGYDENELRLKYMKRILG